MKGNRNKQVDKLSQGKSKQEKQKKGFWGQSTFETNKKWRKMEQDRKDKS